MSQRAVQLVIGRLLTDAAFRRRVERGGSAYLVRLRTHCIDLSREEVAALIERDPRVWSGLAKQIDPRVRNGHHTLEQSDADAWPLLTTRQQEVLGGVGDGLGNQAIGIRLGVSEGAVKATVQQLFRKLSVRRRVQLVRLVLERSLGKQPPFDASEPQRPKDESYRGRNRVIA